MESSQRGALGLVRLVACCLIIVGLLDAGLYITQYVGLYSRFQHHHGPRPSLHIVRIILDFIPVIAGLAIVIKARAVAEWVSNLIE